MQMEVNGMIEFNEEDLSPNLATLFAVQREQKIEQGTVERTRTIVLNMHVKQIPTEVIAEFIGVSFEDAQNIIEENSR